MCSLQKLRYSHSLYVNLVSQSFICPSLHLSDLEISVKIKISLCSFFNLFDNLLRDATHTLAVDASSLHMAPTNYCVQQLVYILCPSVYATKKHSDKSQLQSKQTQMDHPQRMSWLLVAISNVGKCVDKKSPRVTMHASFLTPMTTVSVCIGISHALPYSTVCTLPSSILLYCLYKPWPLCCFMYSMAMAVYKTAESVYTTCMCDYM